MLACTEQQPNESQSSRVGVLADIAWQYKPDASVLQLHQSKLAARGMPALATRFAKLAENAVVAPAIMLLQ